jgi:anti-anti-sigma factor
MGDGFAIDVSMWGREVTLRVEGDVDMAHASELLDALLVAGVVQQNDRLVVDLSRVTFMDSSGIASLIEAHKRLLPNGTGVAVVDVPPIIAKAMQMCAVDTYLDIRHGDGSRDGDHCDVIGLPTPPEDIRPNPLDPGSVANAG